MNQYEYTILQSAAGARTSLLNERIEALAVEGWEPILMSGDATVNVMLRRLRQSAAARTTASAQAQTPRPAPAQPTAAPQPQRPPTP